MALTFPIDCDTAAKRTEYCYRGQELLRLLHNLMGKWYREGLTQAQWDKLPAKVKKRYPYKAQLTKDEWQEFVKQWMAFSNKVVEPLLENRELLKQSTTWQIDVNEIVDGD